MSNTKKKCFIPDSQLKAIGTQLAWKKAGFQDRTDLFDKVDSLSSDEKLSLLCQIFQEELACKYLKNKMTFIQSLGGRTYVTPDDVYQHLISEGYTEENGWKFRDYSTVFYNHYEVDPDDLRVIDCAWSMD